MLRINIVMVEDKVKQIFDEIIKLPIDDQCYILLALLESLNEDDMNNKICEQFLLRFYNYAYRIFNFLFLPFLIVVFIIGVWYLFS